MSERDQILISLVKEVLGPRNGPTEVLPEERDPRSEFITGVLEPARKVEKRTAHFCQFHE